MGKETFPPTNFPFPAPDEVTTSVASSNNDTPNNYVMVGTAVMVVTVACFCCTVVLVRNYRSRRKFDLRIK